MSSGPGEPSELGASRPGRFQSWYPRTTGAELVASARLVATRLRLHCTLRFAVAATIAVGALCGRYLLGLEALDVGWLMVVAAAVAGYGFGAYQLVLVNERGGQRSERVLRVLRHVTVTLDYLALTALVYLLGGARTPFSAIFLLHAALNGVMMSRRGAITHSAIGYSLLAALVLAEWQGLIDPGAIAPALCMVGAIDATCAATLLLVYGFLFAAFTFLLSSLAAMLRAEEDRAIAANNELGKLSRNRRDFLQVALHDLNSPISAAAMLLDNLEAGVVGQLNEKQHDLVTRSLRRLRDCSGAMRGFQMLALLESDDYKKHAEYVDINQLVSEVAEEHRDDAHHRQHQLALDLADALPAVYGIAFLLREAVANFVTNAIKYTPNGGKIVISTHAGNDTVRVEVQDNGMGIPREQQTRLFEEFVRFKPANSAVPKAPGTGLGLSIAKRIAESHGGSVSVVSDAGAGARFIITLPANRPTLQL